MPTLSSASARPRRGLPLRPLQLAVGTLVALGFALSGAPPVLGAMAAGAATTASGSWPARLANAPARGEDDDALTLAQLEQRIFAAFDAEDHARAAGLLDIYLERTPNHPTMLYNLACARAAMGDVEAGAAALFRAVEAGFRDFDHLRTDPDLAALRGTEIYRTIVEASSRKAHAHAQTLLDGWKSQYGDRSYRYEIDEDRRLAFATALDPVAHREMRRMLEEEADHLIATFFESPPADYVLVAIPTPRDADGIFEGDDSIGGRYVHARRRLVSRDIGGSLRHEFFHALHYGHMERLRREGRLGDMRSPTPHPIWIQEGLASLYEDYEIVPPGRVRYLPNDRTDITRKLVQSGRAVSWSQLFGLSGEAFMARAPKLYPQARSIFRFVAERGLLAPWYATYVDRYEDDTTGALAMEVVFGEPLANIELEWRAWARQQRVDTTVRPGDASLGIAVEETNDGVRIVEFQRGSAARRAGLREGDVVVSVNRQPTRALRELHAALAQHRVGDRVRVRVRRGQQYQTLTVELRPLRP